MAGASTLDPDNMPPGTGVTDGSSTGVLGPSDTTDTGSDVSSGQALDPAVLGSDSDASGTGEEAGAPGRAGGGDLQADVGFDRVVGRDEAGLGGGLDQAEEAQLGRLDEDGATDDLSDEPDPVLAGDTDADTAADLDSDGLIGSDDADGDSDQSDDGGGAGVTRRASSMHGNADEDEEDEQDEEDDEADENEGEPANPAREAPGIDQDERAQMGLSLR